MQLSIPSVWELLPTKSDQEAGDNHDNSHQVLRRTMPNTSRAFSQTSLTTAYGRSIIIPLWGQVLYVIPI